MRGRLITFFVLGAFFVLLSGKLTGQNANGYIYGEVTLKNGSSYEGLLRWENEEAYWDNLFFAYKGTKPLKGLMYNEEASIATPEDDLFQFDFMQLWENRSPELKFTFKCHFGDIEYINVSDEKHAAIQFKNKDWLNIKKGAISDLGENINIYFANGTHKKIKWESINLIHFKSPPSDMEPIGDPLYGKIVTTNGTFTGFIMWDMDECMDIDLLGGYMDNTKKEIKFKDISLLKTHNNGSKIILKSGGELFLNNHDDTSDKNKGILVKTNTMGKVKINWSELISAEFFPPCNPLKGRNDFDPPETLKGRVVTTGDRVYSGNIVYDMDERLNIELLDGKNGGFYYYIPFYNIKSVTPQNFEYSLVTLKSGESIILGGHNDVSHGNNGVIISNSGNKQIIPWSNIKNIIFD